MEAIARESRDSGFEPPQLARRVAEILLPVLFLSAGKNRPDTGGKLGSLLRLRASRSVAHGQVVASLAEAKRGLPRDLATLHLPVAFCKVLPGLVHRYDGAHLVQHAYVRRKCIDRRLSKLLGLASGLFGLTALGDIRTESHVPQELTPRR